MINKNHALRSSFRTAKSKNHTTSYEGGFGRQKTHSGDSFDKILQKQLEGAQKLSFTKHAQMRMSERNINLTERHLERLDQAVKKAGQKGVKDTLILMDQMAFIVSVINNTVVTAINGDDIEGNVFTNIDGAVVV